MVNLELLKESQLIKTLNKEEQSLLLLNMTKVQYAKGESIVKSGEFTSHILFVDKGFVKLHSEFKNKAIILNLNRAGTFPGLTTMIGSPKHKLDITAIDDSVICLINIDIFRNLIENNGKFALEVITHVNTSMLEYIEHNFTSQAHNNIHGRLAKILLYLSEEIFCSDHFDFLLSRKELSQFCNISRENVIKVLYEFDKEGIIKLNSKHIQIIQPNQLKHYSEIS